MTVKKIAFVTGANRGLGFETARELGENAVYVILGSRDESKGQKAVAQLKAKGIESETFVFEVNNPLDHDKLASYLENKFGRLDILINNAGVYLDENTPGGGANRTATTSQDILRRTFDSNFFNVVALTQRLLPLIRKAPAGRIVNLSSVLASLQMHGDPQSPIYDSKAFAYNASKTALNAFTVHLAHALKDTKIKVNSAHPGWVKTDMGGASAPMELSEGSKTSVQLALLGENGATGGFFHLGESLPW